MPIRPPALDDRTYPDLVTELVARIPAHTPEWTNPRAGDPGRTLIELFAWLGDTILYRANLIPERQRLAFLRLLGMPLEPAIAARGIVSLQVDDAKNPAAVEVPADALIRKPVPFSTLQYTTAFPFDARIYLKRRLEGDDRKVFDQLRRDLSDVYHVPPENMDGYMTSEVFEHGTMSAAGVDFVADSVDQSLWIALMAPDAKVRELAAKSLERAGEGGPRALNVGVALAYDVPPMSESLGERARVPVVWEISTKWAAGNAEGRPSLISLEPMLDTTKDLSRHGIVRLTLPDAASIGAPRNDVRVNPGAGVGADTPPRLEGGDDDLLVTWVRVRPAPGYSIASLKLAWVGINAVEVEQREGLPDRVLGVSDGGSDQVFDMGTNASGSVDAGRLEVYVGDSGRWIPVDDLGAAGPLDNVVHIDPEAGTLTFGDGIHGRVPPTGMQVIVRGLRVGGGIAGNLAPNMLGGVDTLIDIVTQSRRSPEKKLKTLQALPLAGATAHETVFEAERRIPAYFRHRDRAVTGADYRDLALHAPGVDVARVEVLPRFKPQERQGDVPGVVSVMAWPAKPSVDFTPPYPRADRPLLESVYAYLDARRPLATEMYVIGCAYKPLGLAVAVQIADGFAREQVLVDVRLAIRRYLWPLPLGLDGSDGDWPGGYPLGRALTDRELEIVVARVPGVGGVSPIRVFEMRNGRFAEVAGTGKSLSTFTLEGFELPELTALMVTEGLDAPSTLATPSGGGGNAVYVPVVPEVC